MNMLTLSNCKCISPEVPKSTRLFLCAFGLFLTDLSNDDVFQITRKELYLVMSFSVRHSPLIVAVCFCSVGDYALVDKIVILKDSVKYKM